MRHFLFVFLLLIASQAHATDDASSASTGSTDAKVTLDCDAKIEGATCPNPKKAGGCKRLLDSCGDLSQQSTDAKATATGK